MNKEEKKFCVYVHTNKMNGKKYIGITSQKPKARWGNGKGYSRKQLVFARAINKYGWDGFDHEIIAEGLPAEEAYQMEIELIRKYRSTEREFGYNTDLGGKNSLWTEERKATRRGSNNPMYGKTPWNKGLPRELSPLFGIPKSEATKRAISEKNSGERNGMYGKIPKNALKVRCVEENKIFNSLYEAGTWLGRTSRHRGDIISTHIKAGDCFFGGYHWEFID